MSNQKEAFSNINFFVPQNSLYTDKGAANFYSYDPDGKVSIGSIGNNTEDCKNLSQNEIPLLMSALNASLSSLGKYISELEKHLSSVVIFNSLTTSDDREGKITNKIDPPTQTELGQDIYNAATKIDQYSLKLNNLNNRIAL